MSVSRDLLARTAQAFSAAFGHPPAGIVAAPGRVNLIGEHTDYNDGFVLPMAIDRHTLVAFGPGDGADVTVVALRDGATPHRFSAAGPPLARGTKRDWYPYVEGCLTLFEPTANVERTAVNLLIASDLPQNCGLSSSASLELALLRALAAAWSVPFDPTAAALVGQQVEHRHAGVQCGIMDQLAIARAGRDHVLRIDCRSLAVDAVPVPAGVAVLLVPSGIARGLAGSAYNDRRASCERAARAVGVAALRDADLTAVMTADLDPIDRRRARHVVTENARVDAFVAALRRADLAEMGGLLRASHISMRDDFAITTPELDALADALDDRLAGRGGARMTGGGFGGFLVVLCAVEEADALREEIGRMLTAAGRPGDVIQCRASAGVDLIDAARPRY